MGYLEINGQTVEFRTRCNHPGLRNNICPTGYGDCISCPHCIVTFRAMDVLPELFKLQDAYNASTKASVQAELEAQKALLLDRIAKIDELLAK